jgi:hypothetical protein
MEKKKSWIFFWGEIQFLRYDVTKWRHNIKIIVDLEIAYQGLSYEVLNDMISYDTVDLKNLTLG